MAKAPTRKPKTIKTTRTVKLEPELQARLDRVAEETGIAPSTLIRLSVRAIIEAFEGTHVLPLPLKLRAVSLEERLSEITEEKRMAG